MPLAWVHDTYPVTGGPSRKNTVTEYIVSTVAISTDHNNFHNTFSNRIKHKSFQLFCIRRQTGSHAIRFKHCGNIYTAMMWDRLTYVRHL